MPSLYAMSAENCAQMNDAVKHTAEEGLEYVRLFNQRAVFQRADGSTAAAEGVCFGCSAYYLKNGKVWAEFKTYLTSGEGNGKALVLSNQILQKEQEITAKAKAKRDALFESTPASLRQDQGATKLMIKDALGMSSPEARAAARQAERDFNQKTQEEAHRQRLASYQRCIAGDLGLKPGTQQAGQNSACSGIPGALFNGVLKGEGSGCLVGMWASGSQRAGHVTSGHAFAVKPSHELDGYAVFDPNFGEVRFTSEADTKTFLETFLGQLTAFRDGGWMVQQYLGCPEAREEAEAVFAMMGEA